MYIYILYCVGKYGKSPFQIIFLQKLADFFGRSALRSFRTPASRLLLRVQRTPAGCGYVYLLVFVHEYIYIYAHNIDLKMEAWRSIVSYSKPNSALKSWFCFFLRTKNRWNQLGHEMYLYVYWFRETFSENQCFILPRSTRLQIVTVVFFRTLILGIFPGTTIWAVLDWLMGFFGWAVGLVDWSVAGGLGRRQLSRIGWCVSYAESCRYSVQKTNKWGSWVPSWNLSNSARLASRQGLPVVNSSQLIWMLVDHIYIPSDSHW